MMRSWFVTSLSSDCPISFSFYEFPTLESPSVSAFPSLPSQASPDVAALHGTPSINPASCAARRIPGAMEATWLAPTRDLEDRDGVKCLQIWVQWGGSGGATRAARPSS